MEDDQNQEEIPWTLDPLEEPADEAPSVSDQSNQGQESDHHRKGLPLMTKAEALEFFSERNIEEHGLLGCRFVINVNGQPQASFTQTNYYERFQFRVCCLAVVAWKDPEDTRRMLNDELSVGHLCGRKICVNPDHIVLESIGVVHARFRCPRRQPLFPFRLEEDTIRDVPPMPCECPSRIKCLQELAKADDAYEMTEMDKKAVEDIKECISKL